MMNKDIILLFGISNVGKTTVGELLSKKMKYTFFDLDEEIKKYYNTTLEEFQKLFPYENAQKKGAVIKNIILKNNKNIIIAVSPIYYSVNFNYLLKKENVLAIELQDTPNNIFDRLLFSDENDNVYFDDEYKNENKSHYIKEIKKDITYYKRAFSKIEFKYFINGKTAKEVSDDLYKLINQKNYNC